MDTHVFFVKRLPHRQLLPVLLVVANALVTQQAVNQVLSRVRRSNCKQGGESGEKRNQGTIELENRICSTVRNIIELTSFKLKWPNPWKFPPCFPVNQIQNDWQFAMSMVVYLSVKGDHRIIPKKMHNKGLEVHYYCWWKKSCTSWYGKYQFIPLFTRFLNTSQVVGLGISEASTVP